MDLDFDKEKWKMAIVQFVHSTNMSTKYELGNPEVCQSPSSPRVSGGVKWD